MTHSADYDRPRWHLNPPCGHHRCKGYTSCKWADRDLFALDADVTVYWPDVRPCYDRPVIASDKGDT